MPVHKTPWETRLKAALEHSELGLKQAFAGSTFVYGTSGIGGMVVRGLKKHFGEAAKKVLGRELNLFDPGRRAVAYLDGDQQMMDLYYGQEGTTLHLRRIAPIAKFVHYAMGYDTPFRMERSGRDEYLFNFRTAIEGWAWNTPALEVYEHPATHAKLTATKEISRIIRWGIQKYGGTLIFEGREVYYSQVFRKSSPRVSDTDEEARELFQYFLPGQAKAKFGKGDVVFHWGGKPTVPTKLHFVSNWQFGPALYSQVVTHRDLAPQAAALPHAGVALKPKAAAHQYRNLRLERGKVILDAGPDFFPTWNNFLDMPEAISRQNPAEVLQAVEMLLAGSGF